MKIYCRGRIVEENEAVVSAHDHGYLYGMALFETFRTYGGAPFLLDEHMARLATGCRAYGIAPGEGALISPANGHLGLRKLIRELLSQNSLNDAVFRYTLSGGEKPSGLSAGDYTSPTEILYIRPLPDLPESLCLHLLNTRRNEPEVFPRPKSAQYMNSLLGRRELQRLGARPGDEGLMLTPDDRLSEGTVSNLFLVSGNGIATPSTSSHILSGITRKRVLELAQELGLKAVEKDLHVQDLLAAEAIFTTNSVQGISPVHEVQQAGRNTVWQKESGGNPVVRKLLSAYATLRT